MIIDFDNVHTIKGRFIEYHYTRYLLRCKKTENLGMFKNTAADQLLYISLVYCHNNAQYLQLLTHWSQQMPDCYNYSPIMPDKTYPPSFSAPEVYSMLIQKTHHLSHYFESPVPHIQ